MKHHNTIHGLQEAARNHCQMCLSIYKRFSTQFTSSQSDCSGIPETIPFITYGFSHVASDGTRPPTVTFNLPWGNAVFFLLEFKRQYFLYIPFDSFI